MHACLKVGDNLSTIRRQVLVPRFITILQMVKKMKVGGLKHHGLKNHFDSRTYEFSKLNYCSFVCLVMVG
jgi:hypothetical protein